MNRFTTSSLTAAACVRAVVIDSLFGIMHMCIVGLTPLHLAAACGNPDCFKELVKAHADVNVQVESVFSFFFLSSFTLIFALQSSLSFKKIFSLSLSPFSPLHSFSSFSLFD